jgi:hypothetical protein
MWECAKDSVIEINSILMQYLKLEINEKIHDEQNINILNKARIWIASSYL